MPSSIGERIKDLRNRCGFKQQELADKIGVSRQVLSNWERGYTPLDSDGVTKLAKILEVPTDYILFGEVREIQSAAIERILDAVKDDEELFDFVIDISQRNELQLLLKQVRPLKADTIKRIIRYIKIVEDEEANE